MSHPYPSSNCPHHPVNSSSIQRRSCKDARCLAVPGCAIGRGFFPRVLWVAKAVRAHQLHLTIAREGAPFILGKADSSRLDAAPGQVSHTQRQCHAHKASLPWDRGVPVLIPILPVEHSFPTPGAALDSRSCQGMENRATASTGEPANTFSRGMQKRRHLIPPSPLHLLSRHTSPQPTCQGRGGWGFLPCLPSLSPSKGHLGFRPAHASPCSPVIATWSPALGAKPGWEQSTLLFFTARAAWQGGLGALGAG